MPGGRLRATMLGLVLLAATGWGAAPASAFGPPPSVPPAEAAALEAAVRGYAAAFLANDITAAYAALSSDCQAELSKAELRKVVKPIARKYGDAEIVTFKIAKFSGDRARVTYRFDESAIDVKKEPWVLEDGVWRRDC